jgi:hypothetical protein
LGLHRCRIFGRRHSAHVVVSESRRAGWRVGEGVRYRATDAWRPSNRLDEALSRTLIGLRPGRWAGSIDHAWSSSRGSGESGLAWCPRCASQTRDRWRIFHIAGAIKGARYGRKLRVEATGRGGWGRGRSVRVRRDPDAQDITHVGRIGRADPEKTPNIKAARHSALGRSWLLLPGGRKAGVEEIPRSGHRLRAVQAGLEGIANVLVGHRSLKLTARSTRARAICARIISLRVTDLSADCVLWAATDPAADPSRRSVSQSWSTITGPSARSASHRVGQRHTRVLTRIGTE